jgi:hypothetical protein
MFINTNKHYSKFKEFHKIILTKEVLLNMINMYYIAQV